MYEMMKHCRRRIYE